MKRFFVKLLVFLIILAGAAWLLYPLASDSIATGMNADLMKRYHQIIRGMSAEQTEKLLENAEAYNETLTETGIPDVFSTGNKKSSRNYQAQMNVLEGIIGELQIPKIGVSLPIYHGGQGAGADERLIHVPESDLPTDEDGIHTVLAGPGIQAAQGFLGELKLTDARMLEDLDKIIPDDLVFLNVLDRTFIYQVEGVRTLAAEGLAAEAISGEEGGQTLTVLTERKDRRLLIRARRVEPKTVREKLVSEDLAVIPTDVVNILALGIPVMMLGILVMMIIGHFKKKSYRLPNEHKKRKREDSEEEPEDENRNTRENTAMER